METIGEKVKKFRKQKGLTQSDLAAACGTQQSTISNLENNDTERIYLSVAVGLANTLGISLNELFNIEITANDHLKIEDLMNEVERLVKDIDESKKLSSLLSNRSELLQMNLIEVIATTHNSIMVELDQLEINSPEGIDKTRENIISGYNEIVRNLIMWRLISEKDIEVFYKDNESKGEGFKYKISTTSTLRSKSKIAQQNNDYPQM